MVEKAEKIIEVGFVKDPKVIFDEVESISAKMARSGWTITDSIVEDSLGFIHIFFERVINKLST